MTIEVTQDDIDMGLPECVYQCPVARAFRRSLGRRVAVGRGLVYVEDVLSYLLPPEAVKFVSDFDKQRPVTPFTFVAK